MTVEDFQNAWLDRDPRGLPQLVRMIRARRERLRELLGEVQRLEQLIDEEITDIQAMAAEGRLIMRQHREAS
jgi:hypothetical protein